MKSNERASVAVLLPAHNEGMSIGRMIDEVKSLAIVSRVVVVDNASTDGTREIALGKNVALINEPRKGKGLAIRTALKNVYADYYIILNSDCTYPVDRIPDVVEALKKYDAVICPRAHREDGAMSPLHGAGNAILTGLANLLYGTCIRDLCSGMYGLRREVAERMELTSRGFSLEADIFVNLVRLGCRVGELPVSYKPRLDGSRAKLRAGNALGIGWFLVKRRFSVRW